MNYNPTSKLTSRLITKNDLRTDLAQDFRELLLNLSTPDSLIFVVDALLSPTGAPKLQVYKAFGPVLLLVTICFTLLDGLSCDRTSKGPRGLL